MNPRENQSFSKSSFLDKKSHLISQFSSVLYAVVISWQWVVVCFFSVQFYSCSPPFFLCTRTPISLFPLFSHSSPVQSCETLCRGDHDRNVTSVQSSSATGRIAAAWRSAAWHWLCPVCRRRPSPTPDSYHILLFTRTFTVLLLAFSAHKCWLIYYSLSLYCNLNSTFLFSVL